MNKHYDFVFDNRNQITFPAGVMYHLFMDMFLRDNPINSIIDNMKRMQIELSFRPEQFWCCVTGLKKEIYTNVYGYNNIQYMGIFTPLRHTLLDIINAHDWDADIFLIMDNNRKQFGIIMSPVKSTACSAEDLALKIGQTVQKEYEKSIFKNDSSYCNFTSLSEEQHGLDAIKTGFKQAFILNDTAFFNMEPVVMTEDRLNSLRKVADYQTVMNTCEKMFQLLDNGNKSECYKTLKYLFENLLRYSYNKKLLSDTFNYLRYALLKRYTVWDLTDDLEIETLCDLDTYHRIEECIEALWPALERVGAAVNQNGTRSSTVINAIYHIKKHFTEDLSVPEIASYSGVTANYLSSIFRQNMGITVRDYVNQCRIKEAERLLINSNMQVAEVSDVVGIHDVKYFARLFKKHTDISPSQYRIKHIKDLHEESKP